MGKNKNGGNQQQEALKKAQEAAELEKKKIAEAEETTESEDRRKAVESFLNSLSPDIRRRVHCCNGIQKDFNHVNEMYLNEMKTLERKFEQLYAPLFDRRCQIVSGKAEPTTEEIGEGAKIMEVEDEADEATKASNTAVVAETTEVKGVPSFWLTALKNHEAIEDFLTERDEDCLRFLFDISSLNFEDPSKGFKLTFHFNENPYFKQTELVKTYFLSSENGEVVLEKTEGCTIDWLPEKNLTVVSKKKKQRSRGAGKNVRTVVSEEKCKSFFNFFTPPKLPADDESIEEEDEDAMDELEELIEADYDIGRVIKDKIIPKAVDWYTGEAIPKMDFDFGGHEEDDDGDEIGDAKENGLKDLAKQKKPECDQQ